MKIPYYLIFTGCLLTGGLFGCSKAWFPYERHPIPEISVEQAKEIRANFCLQEKLDCQGYFEEPRLLDSSYVFYSSWVTFEKAAADQGIWVNIRSGEASFLHKKKR